MINLHIKFEVFVFAHYEDTKGNAKCRNWGGLGVRSHPRSPAMSPFNSTHTTTRNYITTRLSCTVFGF